jgi:hypothetical protein
MASKAELGEHSAPGNASPSTSTVASSVSLPIDDQKQEVTSVDDATTADTEVPMFHKPPPREFALIMIA